MGDFNIDETFKLFFLVRWGGFSGMFNFFPLNCIHGRINVDQDIFQTLTKKKIPDTPPLQGPVFVRLSSAAPLTALKRVCTVENVPETKTNGTHIDEKIYFICSTTIFQTLLCVPIYNIIVVARWQIVVFSRVTRADSYKKTRRTVYKKKKFKRYKNACAVHTVRVERA